MADNVPATDKRFDVWQECNGTPVKNREYNNKAAYQLKDVLPPAAANNAAQAAKMLSALQPGEQKICICSLTVGERVYNWMLIRTV